MRSRIFSIVLALACALPGAVLGGSHFRRAADEVTPDANVVGVVTAIIRASASVSTTPAICAGIRYVSLGQILNGR